MKASMLGLALSTVAFGASSIYLWQQLDAARSQYAAVVAASKTLSARIAELEKSRAEFAGQRFADQGRFGGGMMAQGGLGPAQAPPPPAGEDEPASNTARFDASVKRPEMPPAMLKMMRSQMRAQNKRTYFDLRESLGLSDEQSDKLIDLITEQQTAGFNATRNLDPEQARAQWEAVREKQKAEITDLLGPTKAAQFEDYQKSMPARMELQALSQQFESSTAPLSDDQRKRMLTAYIEERDRIPAPTYSENTPQEEMTKAYSEWQADYDERVAAQARSILSSDQLTTYNEYAQWQKEMRESFAAQGASMPRRIRGGPGNVVFAGAPVAGPAFTVTTVTSGAPTPVPPQTKPK